MAYELHIERIAPEGQEPMPIPISDWNEAIASTDGVRLCAVGASSIVNPATGETIDISGSDGDTEVYFPEQGAWRPVFHWFEGAAHFNVKFNPGDLSHPVWAAAVSLASRLGAVIRGDEGERYDAGAE
jgi:hypothetical protein